MIYALVVMWFIHGVPPKTEGVVVAIFERPEACCEALDLMDERYAFQSIAYCVKAYRERPEETSSMLECGEPL